MDRLFPAGSGEAFHEMEKGDFPFSVHHKINLRESPKKALSHPAGTGGSSYGDSGTGRAPFYFSDEEQGTRELAVADGKADERVARPAGGAQESIGFFLERSAHPIEVGLWAEGPGLSVPEAPHGVLPGRVKKSRIAGLGEPGLLGNGLVEPVAERFRYAEIEGVGIHLEAGELSAEVGFEGAELDGRPVEQRPRCGDEGDFVNHGAAL
jgi:hypothetical protein